MIEVKVMIISDLHYKKHVFREVDESKAWEWLLSIVDYHKPDLLLSCGDWRTAISAEKFYELLRRIVVLCIRGNHDNIDVLARLYNVKTNDHLPVLIEDGRVYEFNGLKIAGINDIIANEKKVKRGVPLKTSEGFLGAAEKLRGKEVDMLLIHDSLPTGSVLLYEG